MKSTTVSYWFPKVWGYYLSYTLPLGTVLLYFLHPSAPLLMLAYAFIFIPIWDALVGKDRVNVADETSKEMDNAFSYKFCLMLVLPVQLALLAFATHYAVLEGIQSLSFWGLAIATGISATGLAATSGHELIHRTDKWEYLFGTLSFGTFAYSHFAVEHVIGHHVRVSTKEDPTSSRLGETLYQFLPRTIIGSYLSFYAFEKKRLARRQIPFFSLNNRIVSYALIPLVYMALLTLIWGKMSIVFFLAQAAVAIILVEMVNYIEHYGLERKEIAPGRYEKVTPYHSWNADHSISNYLLFRLPRHSDHHANATRKYQILRTFDDSPQMPYGYTGMYVLAVFPPLWRKVMDPLVAEYRQKLESFRQEEKKEFYIQESRKFNEESALSQ